jgi:hypothetical protein
MEAYAAMKEGECAFWEGIKKLTDVLTGMARELDDLTESFETGDKELAGQIAAPLVNALDSISAILKAATEKVFEIDTELGEETLKCNT